MPTLKEIMTKDVETCTLLDNVYEVAVKMKEYKNYLFLPIDDYTIPDESYPAGRYLDIEMPKRGDSIVLDFNMLYNPYCAYSDRYSCPITPRKNKIKVRIEAGEKIPILREEH